MAEIIDKIKSAFKSITSTEETEKESTSTAFLNTETEKEAKKTEKNEYVSKLILFLKSHYQNLSL